MHNLFGSRDLFSSLFVQPVYEAYDAHLQPFPHQFCKSEECSNMKTFMSSGRLAMLARMRQSWVKRLISSVPI